jgi:hypothetical protein
VLLSHSAKSGQVTVLPLSNPNPALVQSKEWIIKCKKFWQKIKYEKYLIQGRSFSTMQQVRQVIKRGKQFASLSAAFILGCSGPGSNIRQRIIGSIEHSGNQSAHPGALDTSVYQSLYSV